MRRKCMRWICACIALLLLLNPVPIVKAEEVGDPQVQQVITQLQAIDTLQQIQDNRANYKASGHYDITTTDPVRIEKHETMRAAYEAYVSEMFAARLAAQQSYDALSDSQKQQIPQELTEKLNNTLSTVLDTSTFSVTPSNDAYHFEAVRGGKGFGYEVSNYMVSGEIPQTFILVDTSDGKTSWTPSGLYEFGKSNYEVLYCCDVETPMVYTTDYKRVNLEDSSYFSEDAASHIRGILTNCYPYISLDEMKAKLKADGLNAEFVDQISRSEAMSAAQMAVWTYANAMDVGSYGYFASVDITKNIGTYFTPLHDHSNEVWEWLPPARVRSFDARAEYRVNMLAYALCQMDPVPAAPKTTLSCDLQVTRALAEANDDGSYRVGAYINLKSGGTESDNLKVSMASYKQNEDGTRTLVDRVTYLVNGETKIPMYVNAWPENVIEVTLSGTQTTGKDVYFYEPRGGRDISQSLVGVGMGKTQVYDVETFRFEEEPGEMGLRIYKTLKDKGTPISDIEFSIYRVDPGDDEITDATPSKEEAERYATAENLVGSLVTDVTGYAGMALESGIYLVVEEPNPKVKEPADPFYVWVPMLVNRKEEDGTTWVETVNFVSVYPKNEPPVVPPPPPPPPPSRVVGKLAVSKYDADDSTVKLEGAEFAVYTAAKEGDANMETITVNGIQYSVVPVMVDGAPLVLKTDENGYAVSPDLVCGTYLLVETKAPSRYLVMEEILSVTVVPNTVQEVTLVEVPNKRGFELPETGGIGTTIYTTTGIVLMVAAFALLAVKRRYGFNK